MTAQDWRRLRNAIHKTSQYWFARIILGLGGTEAHGFKDGMHPEEERAVWRTRWRRAYWRLRAEGLSSYEAKARLRGTTPEQERARMIGYKRRYRQRWGGDPTHFGSEAHKRWLLAREGLA